MEVVQSFIISLPVKLLLDVHLQEFIVIKTNMAEMVCETKLGRPRELR